MEVFLRFKFYFKRSLNEVRYQLQTTSEIGLKRRVDIRLSQRYDLSQKCLNTTRNSTSDEGQVKALEWPKSGLRNIKKNFHANHLISASMNPLFCKETTTEKGVKKLSQNSCLKAHLLQIFSATQASYYLCQLFLYYKNLVLLGLSFYIWLQIAVFLPFLSLVLGKLFNNLSFDTKLNFLIEPNILISINYFQ